MKTHFQLDKLGNLSLTTKFDRENLANPRINMIIKATPKCLQTPEEVDFPPPNYGTDRSLLWVEVENNLYLPEMVLSCFTDRSGGAEQTRIKLLLGSDQILSKSF